MNKITIAVIGLILSAQAVAQAAPTVNFTNTVSGTISPVTPTLTWSSTGAATCTASSSPSDPLWNGSVATSGTLAVGPVTAQTSYSLTCTSASDTTATLSWVAPTLNTDGTALTNLTGYKVYEVVGTTPTLVSTITSPTTLTTAFNNLAIGTHTYQVTATNSSGIESDPSNQGSKTIAAATSATQSLVVPVFKKSRAPGSHSVK